jgi:hypothetical protein
MTNTTDVRLRNLAQARLVQACIITIHSIFKPLVQLLEQTKVSHVSGVLNPKTIMIRRRGTQRTIYYLKRLIDPNADKEAVVKKINAFRTNYIREKKNFEESHHFGSVTNEICLPTLWY